MHRVVWGLGGGTLCHRAGRRIKVYAARKDSPGRATSTRGKRGREPSADFEASMHFAASIAAQSLLNRCSPFSWPIFPVRSECSLCRRMCSRGSTCHGARLCFIERDTRCQQRPRRTVEDDGICSALSSFGRHVTNQCERPYWLETWQRPGTDMDKATPSADALLIRQISPFRAVSG